MLKVSDLKYLTLCFSGSFKKKPWYSKLAMYLVKKITGSKWSHVCFVYPEGDTVMSQEATTPTVQRIPLYKWLKNTKHEWEIYEINNISLEESLQLLEDLWIEIGKEKYGIFQLVMAFFSYMLRTKNLVTKGVVCSEYVMKGLEKTLYKDYLSSFYDENTISPQDIYEMVILLESVGIAKRLEKVEHVGG